MAHENITGRSGEELGCFSFYPDYTVDERSLPRQKDFAGRYEVITRCLDVFRQNIKMMSVYLYPGEREARINGTVLEAILQNQLGNPSNSGSQYM